MAEDRILNPVLGICRVTSAWIPRTSQQASIVFSSLTPWVISHHMPSEPIGQKEHICRMRHLSRLGLHRAMPPYLGRVHGTGGVPENEALIHERRAAVARGLDRASRRGRVVDAERLT